MSYRHVRLPDSGQKITVNDNRQVVSDNPILGYSVDSLLNSYKIEQLSSEN